MEIVRIAEIGNQLIVISQNAAEQLAQNSYMATFIQRAAVSLFDEAVSLGALNGPKDGLLKGLLTSMNRQESNWEWHYFREVRASLMPKTGSKFPESTANDIVTVTGEMGKFLLAVSSVQPSPIANAHDDAHTSPELNERHEEFLEALLELGATDRRTRKSIRRVAAKAAGQGTDPAVFKRYSAELKRSGHIKTKTGIDGGCWLTDLGKTAAIHSAKR